MVRIHARAEIRKKRGDVVKMGEERNGNEKREVDSRKRENRG